MFSLRRILVVCSTFFFLAFFLPMKNSGQASAPVLTSLESIVVDDGQHSGDVVLKVDFDATGSAANIAPVSGPADLYAPAERVTRLFRHPGLAGSKGHIQTVYFLITANGIKKTQPIYPPVAKAAHVQGTVELVASASPDGRVSAVTLLSGPAMLQGSATDAVLHWAYPPISLDGVAVPFRVVVDIDYKL